MDEAALAAVDLGSNSFHLVVAREIDGRPHVIDKVRVRVGLAEGLSGRTLDGAAQQRAFEALEMFRERLAAVPRDRIRAVGTATFRRVRDGEAFLRRVVRVPGRADRGAAGPRGGAPRLPRRGPCPR